ncbi:methyltransferase-like protein [Novymonas esmeraldas]|uniref:Methyltransferase-like protein n=1 Tax=Novymonas esmeraldas TaxID=1808958 RepID=A0AAW0EY78_9TRYP
MKYVAVFASSASLTAFRLPELQAVAATLHIPVTVLDDAIPWVSGGADTSWFSVFESPASRAELQELAQRCMLLRGFYTLFESTPTLEDLYASLEQRHGAAPAAGPSPATVFVGEDEAAHLAGSTYSYQVETVGKKYTAEAKRAVTEAVLQRVPRAGDVEWRQPERLYYVFLHHAVESAPPGARAWVSDGPLLRVFHCMLCVESSRSALLAAYDLRTRPYIGTTSMPPEESLVMANLSRVSRGHLVYDPFCGTGSLLVAAAHCGAHTFGSDTDGRAMRAGTAKGQTSPQMQQQRRLALAAHPAARVCALSEEERVLPSMLTNFRLYGLPPPDRARMNFSAWPHMWHTSTGSSGGIFDSIITDPPYGLREPRKKVDPVSATTTAEGGSASAAAPASTLSAYATDEVVLDLVLFAAAHLVVGGHLTFWHPTTDNYTDEELPTHPSLRLICNIAQRVSLKIVRRLIVFLKVAPVPTPPPTRASCAARRSPDDLRALMDATVLPDNADYTHYRAKRERKRAAAHLHRAAATATAAHVDANSSSSNNAGGGGGGNRRGRKHDRLDGQDEIVANRQRNIELRAAKQAASHLENATHKTVDRSRPS